MKFLIFFLIIFYQLSFANSPCEQIKNLDQAPVQTKGRIKPLLVHASEEFRFITGKSAPFKESPAISFCKLSLNSIFPFQDNLPILVEHTEAKKILELEEKAHGISLEDIEEKVPTLRLEYQKIKEDNSLKKELRKIISRYQLLKSIREGVQWTIPGNKSVDDWAPITSLFSLPSSLQENFEKRIGKFEESFESTHHLEYNYHKANLFTWSLLLSLLAIFLLFIIKKSSLPALLCTGLTLLLQVTAMSIRIFISGRAPITNMYETVMFSGLGCLIFALIIYSMNSKKLFLYGGLSYNILCLFMMKFANNMLDSSIKPLVPVLRDNFWLSTHVTTIILSYAALALSWLMANITLVQGRFSTLSQKDFNENVRLIYTAIKVGVVLLSAGIILGGVWADYSWGRFWGWDPKETWSLIVLLIYMAILHGKYSSWIPPKRFVPLVAAAFLAVMMAWFGVNYILASGLHSYGFSEGGAIFLMSFFAVQIGILIVTSLSRK